MIKYPVGVQSFEKIRHNNNVYVDKTALIYQLVTNNNCVFLSRPRRFGKSLLLSTIEAYFEGQKELFQGLEIEKLESQWVDYPVLHLQLTSTNTFDPDSLGSVISQQFSVWENRYGLEETKVTTNGTEDISARFRNIIIKIWEKTGKNVVVLVDEYDNPLINTINKKEIHDSNKALLKSVYTNLKDLDRYLRFVMLTGVSQFTNTSIFSGLNNLVDISLDSNYSTICGFTEEEIKTDLWEGVEEFAKENEITPEESLALLKLEYDGYHFSKKLIDIYNPFSLLNCLNRKEIGNYWVRSGTPTFLIEKLMEQPVSFSKIFNSEASDIELSERDTVFSSPLALMYQTGYLTIKSYDRTLQTYKLRVPNREIEKSLGSDIFTQIYRTHLGYDFSLIRNLRVYLENGEPDEFFKALKSFLAGVPGVINHKNMLELNFENTIYVLLMATGADIQAEHSVAAGRIDLLIKTSRFIYVIELKYDSTPKKALEQIEKNQYALPFEADGRKLFKIGVNFSKKTKNITGWKIVE